MKATMTATLVPAFAPPLDIRDVEEPTAETGQEVVIVDACGGCHTNLHMAMGDWPDKLL